MKTQAFIQPLKGLLIAVFIVFGLMSIDAQSASVKLTSHRNDMRAYLIQANMSDSQMNTRSFSRSFVNRPERYNIIREKRGERDNNWLYGFTSPGTNSPTAGQSAEKEVVVEDWMMNFNIEEHRNFDNVSGEEEMRLEPWMSNFSIDLNKEEASEQEIRMEPWMTDFSIDLNHHRNESLSEPEMEIENWMLDASQWIIN